MVENVQELTEVVKSSIKIPQKIRNLGSVRVGKETPNVFR